MPGGESMHRPESMEASSGLEPAGFKRPARYDAPGPPLPTGEGHPFPEHNGGGTDKKPDATREPKGKDDVDQGDNGGGPKAK
jgi:hypothetical protein